jgi:hypothetical protein
VGERRSERGAAEADLVAVRIVKEGFAYAVFVDLGVGGLKAAGGDLDDADVEVFKEEGVHGVAGVLGAEVDIEVTVFGELPDGFGVVGKEGGWGAEQALVPGEGGGIIRDGDAGEEVQGHVQDRAMGATLVGGGASPGV